jgi:hypothetical protein
MEKIHKDMENRTLDMYSCLGKLKISVFLETGLLAPSL